MKCAPASGPALTALELGEPMIMPRAGAALEADTGIGRGTDNVCCLFTLFAFSQAISCIFLGHRQIVTYVRLENLIKHHGASNEEGT